MALKNRLKEAADPAKPTGFSCPNYEPQPGSKRCRSYLDRGACALPSELMCREWMRANNQGPAPVEAGSLAAPVAPITPEPERPLEAPARDLFGQPVRSQPAAALVKARPDQPKRAIEPEPEPPGEPDPVRGLTTEDLESFKELGVEVCLRSEALGEVWLVPERTGQDRKESTPELAATIVRVGSAFPGSRVVALSSTREPVNHQEAPAP